jgi:hypothetical protein
MKKYLLTIVSLVFIQITQAEVLQIDLSPTNGVSGLSPINEVPAVTNSSGSGGEISSGITFDTETSTLSLAIGYGSAAGFTDLTGSGCRQFANEFIPCGESCQRRSCFWKCALHL